MIDAVSLYEACDQLFDNFPLAARDVDHSGTIRSMVLMLRDGDDPRFFLLAQGCGEGGPLYSMCRWPAGDAVDIDARGSDPIPDVLASAVTRGMPLPRHGSVFGWVDRAAFGALIVIYNDGAPGRPMPRWSVMPLAGLPESQWPPFTGRSLFGQWFWEDYWAGSIVSLDQLIAHAPGSVFWVNTRAVLAADSCAVVRDIPSPDGHTLRRGRYVYCEALRSGRPVPSLTALLADPGKIDMAPRFRRTGPPMLVTDRIRHRP
jgi:hypothetical protein